jgi:hypothetical protein
MKLAVVSTVYYKYSHTDVILTRWFDKRDTDKDWGWNGPRSHIVSAYIAQFPENDMGVETLKKNDVPLYKTVHETLCCGGDSLAVDAVLLIGEHGDYPYNRFGQKLYPRKELFDKIVEVFDATGKAVPVFNDKHLSWDYDLAKLMIESSRKKGVRLLASSSAPFCHYEPFINPQGSELCEVVALFLNVHGQPDHYGYHSLEFVQQFIERRQGGEVGVERVTAYLGDEAWKAQDANLWSKELFEAALGASNPEALKTYRQEDKHPFITRAFRLEYADGLNVTHVGVSNIDQHVLAFRQKGSDAVATTKNIFGDEDSYYAHFAALSRVIEDFFWNEVEPFPLERSLFTAGTLQAMIHAQQLPGIAFPTPHLKIAYAPAAKAVGLDYWERGSK